MLITHQISSQLDLVPKFISSVIEALKKENSLSEEDIFHIRLVLEEALTNAMRHGNKLNPALEVSVQIKFEKDQLMIDVKDQGEGFDYERVPNPTKGDRLLMTSGRGVFLMKKYVDHMEFYEGGRGIRMIKNLHPDKRGKV